MRCSSFRIFSERTLPYPVANGNNRLQNDRPGVEIFVDEMDGAAANFTRIRAPDAAIRAREGREQRRMDIQMRFRHLGPKKGDSRRMYPARQIRSIRVVQDRSDLAVVDFALRPSKISR